MAETSPGAIIGRNVRAVRERNLFSRTDLAERSGVSLAGIDHLERGQSARPRRRTIEKLAEALDVDVDTLMTEAASPLAEAPPLQDRLFNGGSKERGAFIERCRRYVAARVAHYENLLDVAKRGGRFAGYEGAKALQDDAFEEFSHFVDLTNGELLERWLEDPKVPEDVKEELGFALVEAQNPFIQVVGRIGNRVKELAETPAQLDEVKQREPLRDATRLTGAA